MVDFLSSSPGVENVSDTFQTVIRYGFFVNVLYCCIMLWLPSY